MAYAVISVIGHDRPGFVRELAGLAASLSLNIEDTRATGLGQEFAVLMSVTGTDSNVDAMATQLDRLADRQNFEYVLRRSSTKQAEREGIDMVATVLAMDHPGIVHAVSGFFADRGLNIRELSTETRPAPHTGAPMFDLRLVVQTTPDGDSEQLTQDFLSFCNAEDLDGSMEPDT